MTRMERPPDQDRIGPFDVKYELPRETDSNFVTEPERKRMMAMDQITEKDVQDLFPAEEMSAPQAWEIDQEVKRAHLVMDPGEETQFKLGTDPLGMEDVGRFVRFQRDELLDLLPEGPCGEFSRDLTLVPSRTRRVGLMARKLSVELMMQLGLLEDLPRIHKSGFLVDGKRGVGKSQVLNLVTLWARQRGWLVILEPTPSRYSKEIAEIKRSTSGVYIQNEFAQQFLEAMSVCNRHMLEDIPVDLSVYGSCALDGTSTDTVKQLYEPLIDKTVEREALEKKFSTAKRLEQIADYRSQVRLPSMRQSLSHPVSVWEIVEFGIENEAYATQVVYELFAQLKVQTKHPLLIVVDEWNECFPVSEYVSVRYDNTRYHGYIPAYHLAMPRAFHRWDGHQYKRGLRLHATSWMRGKRRDYKPELLGVKDHEIRTVRNFTGHEFANYVAYFKMMNILHKFPRDQLEYYFMMTQGNGKQARKLLTTLY